MASPSLSRSKEMLRSFIQLNDAEQKSVLQMIKTFLKSREKQSERVTIEQYNREIDEALAEVVAGNYVTQEELERAAAKW
jgi:DNA-directed RNA polymerase